MTELFERWKKHRDEKNSTNCRIGDYDIALTEEEAEHDAKLIQRYNDLYAEMYKLQVRFTDEDWEAYEAEQEEFRESERQSWLIKDRYGDREPPQGISDWWTG